ncbi:MAG TPA: DUF2304 domain-containing protein [Solirubrobacteraceae bacterium]|nr:DUF2304 domain-containing protein [Solirubrobacteraceae bacterium]
MGGRIQLVAILASLVLLLGVLEMVRRRRLMERYALLWLLSALVLLALASWPGALHKISTAVGIFYPPTTLFLVAFVFVLLLLLHFSAAVSRLSDQTKVLAQRLALLEERVRRAEQAPSDETSADPELERLRAEYQRRRFARISSD